MREREQEDRSCRVQASFVRGREGNLFFIVNSESGPKLTLWCVTFKLGSKAGHGVKPWMECILIDFGSGLICMKSF